MLICEIFRDSLFFPQYDYILICEFPSGTEFITVTLIWTDEHTEVREFQLDPEKSTEVPILLCYQEKY
jgi:hypothetical protein